jgi:hypothetical protein
MGFGIKTDYPTGRRLDLDKSYKYLIKPVVERQGLVCIRADEIRRSGNIDVPMYEELLTADVVIADLSTANPNAFYELGIRHGLRPRTTIVISEDKMPLPFDINHVKISKYTHLGEDIGASEVERFTQLLEDTLHSVLQAEEPDSPVYTFLQKLKPPVLPRRTKARRADAHIATTNVSIAETSNAPTLAKLVEDGERALDHGNYTDARKQFASALRLCECAPGRPGGLMSDAYLRQRLVLSSYKPLRRGDVEGLEQAKELLAPLRPDESNDPETIGLAGAIEKRLYEATHGVEHLSRAIAFRARGYYLRDDLYNGTSLALLLNMRADASPDSTEPERTADLVFANRVRQELLFRSKRKLAEIHQRRDQSPTSTDEHSSRQSVHDLRQEFWCYATNAAAHFGLGNLEDYASNRESAAELSQPDWMMQTLDGHIAQLRSFLTKHGHLLDPPWPGANQ